MDIELIDIRHEQVTPEILALFDITKPTMPRAFHVLEGINRGQILVDDLTRPIAAVVRDGMYGTLYFGGRVTSSRVAAIVQHFRSRGEVGIGCSLVCEAATGAPTHGWIEVGVKTAEAYRGHGFASIACTHLIELCEAQGYKTWWDCARQNTPSVKLAKKLGYQNDPEYRYVWWAKGNSQR